MNSDLLFRPSIKWNGLQYACLFGIMALALGLRLANYQAIKTEPLFDFPLLDAKSYDDWGWSLASGEGGVKGVYFQSPLYPYFLGSLYTVLGHDIPTVLLIQSILGILTPLFIFLAARELFAFRVSVLAGVLAAMFAPFIYYDGLLLKESLGTMLVSLFLFCASRAIVRENAGWLLFAGLAFGGAVLCRGNLMLTLPFILLALVMYVRAMGWALFFVMGTAIALAPVTLHNLLAGEFVLITAQGGQNLYIGNNPYADGAAGRPPELRANPEYEESDFRRLAEKETGRTLTSSEVSGFWSSKAWQFIQQNPGKFIQLLGRKFLLFFSHAEVPDNRDFQFYRQYSTVLQNPIGVFAIILPLAFAGFIGSLRQGNRFLIWYLFFLSYTGGCLLFHVYSRYRQPVMPLLIVMAAFGAFSLLEALREKNTSGLVGSALAALLGVVLIMNGTGNYSFAQPHYNQGYGYMKKEMLDQAITEFREATRMAPDYSEAWNNLGICYQKMGKTHEAEGAFRSVISSRPDFPEAHLNLGTILAQMGKNQEAEKEFQTAMNLRPNYFKALFNLGNLYLMTGRTGEGVFQLLHAEEAEPDNSEVKYKLAKGFETQRNFKKAVEYWMRYLETAEGKPGEEVFLQEARGRLQKYESGEINQGN